MLHTRTHSFGLVRTFVTPGGNDGNRRQGLGHGKYERETGQTSPAKCFRPGQISSAVPLYDYSLSFHCCQVLIKLTSPTVRRTNGWRIQKEQCRRQPTSQGFGSLFLRFKTGRSRCCARTTSQSMVTSPRACVIRATHAVASSSTWCSQILSTLQPRRRNFSQFLRSRSRLPPILFRQKVGNLWRQTGNRHPCQKSPLTKTATLAFGKTKSGHPGRARSCCRNLSRKAFSRAWIYRSGVVFFPLILDITRLRCSGDMKSTMGAHLLFTRDGFIASLAAASAARALPGAPASGFHSLARLMKSSSAVLVPTRSWS